MRRRTFTTMLAGMACAAAVCGPPLAQAQAPKAGTAPEARAMLKRAKPPVSGDGAYGEPTLWGGLENWSNDPVRKTSYVTRIDDHVCGVGYYR